MLIKINAFETWRQGEFWWHRNEQKHGYTQARNQKSAMRVGLFRGLRVEPATLENFVFFFVKNLILGLFG